MGRHDRHRRHGMEFHAEFRTDTGRARNSDKGYAEHGMAYPHHAKRLYRSRNGRIFGVCRGIANYMDVSVRVVRILAIIAVFVTGFWPVIGAYCLMALLIKPEPVLPIESEDDAEFYNSYTGSREMAIQRIKRVYDSLDRRIQRMEAIVTARDYDWDRRLNEGK